MTQPKRNPRRLALALGGVLIVGLAAFAARRRQGTALVLQPVTDARLLGAAATRGEWLSYGRDYTNQRFVPLTQLDRTTVGDLTLRWTHNPQQFRKSADRPESTPIVADGMLIYTEALDVVLALDARTGRELWRYQPELAPVALCCGVVNRGVAVYGNRVFVGTLDARLVALDRRDGTVLWERQIADPSEGYSFTMAPLAVDGKIVIGSSGGDFGIRGFVDAYDPATGRQLWRFWTIPSPDEGGWWGQWSPTTPDGDSLHRNIAKERRDSAQFADAWQHGGGPVWSTPAYDAERRWLIFSTGNPSPVDGRFAPGDNLYATSLIALDIGTGALRWYHQMVPHNIWDYDAASPVVLFDIAAGDSVIPAAAQAGKTGRLYVVDRRTGRPLTRSVPFVPIEHPFALATKEGVRMSPAVRGGANWPPPSYSPQTGLFYVLGSYIPMRFVLDSAAAAKPQRNDELPALASFQPVEGVDYFGTITAIDPAKGTVRWQRKMPANFMYGGTLVTASDLLLVSEVTGYLDILDARTGAMLRQIRVENSVLGPPSAFELDGRQYVAVTSRHGIIAFGL